MNILETRIKNHLLSPSPIGRGLGGGLTPHEVVSHMLCIQAQDRNQHLRAIVSRAGCTQDDIIQTYNDGLIVRTRTQRGTIHVVAAQDVAQMTKLCASKTLGSFTKRRESLGISDKMANCVSLVQDFLKDGPKTRTSIRAYLKEQAPITTTEGNHIYHILCYMGTLGLIVQGPVIDGEHAFVLTSQWIKHYQQISDDKALSDLCLRYFTSHGPATIEDLQRRSGLGKTQIRQGIHLCGDSLSCFRHCEEGSKTEGRGNPEKIYYYNPSQLSFETSSAPSDVHFLAGYDERLLGYKDRTATVQNNHLNKIDVSRNGVFKPTVMISGKTVGIWSIKHKSTISEITITPFEPLTADQQLAVQSEVIHYQTYLTKPITVTIN